ncbi:MAG: FkbM family methyltransferase, partial [Acidimicrobiia bacterium]|nr:FkbM family methyltransferase [Acidimicrobiia bacterium]NNL71290.1 FkbM family methyltransferase [Acidimicrobiia bacterium]
MLSSSLNSVDVGAHAGAILELLVARAPRGSHWAVEPLPAFATQLRKSFPTVTVCQVALSDSEGEAEFLHVRNQPGYSGLRRRPYDFRDPDIERISVRVDTLDRLIPDDIDIHLIKVDVEGGELGVLLGGMRLLRRCRPYVVFEHGRDSAAAYGTRSEQIY